MVDRADTNSSSITVPTPGVRVAVFLLGMCAMLNLYPTQPILGPISAWAGVNSAAAAWTISACTLGVAITAPLAGAISDYLGRKRVITGSVLAMIITTLLCATPLPFSVIIALRFLQGVCIPFIFAVVVAYIAEEFDASDAVRLNAIYVAGTAFGGFSGRFLGGVAASITEYWQLVFLLIALIQIITLITMLRDLPAEKRFVPSDSISAGLRGLGGVLRQPVLIATCFIGASLLFLQVTSFTYGSLHLQGDGFGFSPFQTSLVYLVMLVPAITTPAVGVLIARIGVIPTYIRGSVLAVLGLLITMLPFSWAVIVGLAGSCMAVFIGQACTTRFTAQRFVKSRSAAVGWYLTGYYLGGTIGGVAPAPLYQAQGWIGIVGLLVVIVVIAAVVATMSWQE